MYEPIYIGVLPNGLAGLIISAVNCEFYILVFNVFDASLHDKGY